MRRNVKYIINKRYVKTIGETVTNMAAECFSDKRDR